MEKANELTLTVFIAFLSFTNWRTEGGGGGVFGFFLKVCFFSYNAVFHQTRARIQNFPLNILIFYVNK
jgi:hypothetical protein